MNYSTEIKLAGLLGLLKGMRLVAQAQIRSAHWLAIDFGNTAVGFAYRVQIPALVACLQNVRSAERQLDQIIKELENAQE